MVFVETIVHSPIRRRPSQRRHEVAERLADSRARLEQPDPADGVDARDRRSHGALTLTVLVPGMLLRDRPIRTEIVRHRSWIEERMRVGARNLDDDVEPLRVVVDDAEANAVVVHPYRDVVVGARGLEQPRGMVVHEHLTAPRETGQGQHAFDVATRDGACRRDQPLVVERADEAHLVAAGHAYGRAHRRRGGAAQTIGGRRFRGWNGHP